MSDVIRHECGLAFVRLRQPLTYYRDRYDDAGWGLRKLYLPMEKQHNRGQDGAGMAVVKFDMPPGEAYLKRVRSPKHNAIERVFDAVMRDIDATPSPSAPGAGDRELKQQCALTDGNLNRHLQVLQDAGLVDVRKEFTDRRLQTLCRLTGEGRRRFVEYISVLEQIVEDAVGAGRIQAAPGKQLGQGFSPA